MTPEKRQTAAIKVLILLEPKVAHSKRCPGPGNPSACNCFLFRNAQVRAKALDDAGLLILLTEVKI